MKRRGYHLRHNHDLQGTYGEGNMANKFETCRVQPQAKEPQLTSFTGSVENEQVFSVQSLQGGSKDECTKILIELNHEAARYNSLLMGLGTHIDCHSLRRQLKQTRARVWDRARDAKRKLIPLLRKKNIKIETSEALERMYRVLSACLEFLEEQYQVTLLIQIQFSLFPGPTNGPQNFINTGMSETALPKKVPDPGDRDSGISRSSLREGEQEEINSIQKQITDLHNIVFEMNQSIAIQPWEVEPELETDKFTGDDQEETCGSSIVDITSTTSNNDHRRIRCVSVTILTVIVIIIGGIVGILMGLLD